MGLGGAKMSSKTDDVIYGSPLTQGPEMHKISFIVVQNSSTHIPETIASIIISPLNNMVQLFCPKKSVLRQLILMLPIIISAVKKSPRFLLNSPFYRLSPNKPPSLSIIFPDGYKGGDFVL